MNNRNTHQRTVPAAFLLIAMLLPMLAATPAQADHDRRRGEDICLHGQCGIACPYAGTQTRCNVRASLDFTRLNPYERRAYIDGFVKGDRRGRSIGWEDGLVHREFNPCVRRDFRNRGPFYERGYRDAFADSYDYGWHKAHRYHGCEINRRRFDNRTQQHGQIGRNRRVVRQLGRRHGR